MEALLPEDPEPGEVYEMPEGQVAGASHVLHILHTDQHIGVSESLDRVPNVRGRAMLSRPWSTIELKEGMVLELQFIRYDFKSVRYINYFGWLGHEYHNKIDVTDSGKWEIVALLEAGPQELNRHFYEKVCLRRIKEKD